MFKKIQNYLLLRHPLLWNVKIVPLLAVMLTLHIIFFVLGYMHGAVDFSESNEDYHFDSTQGIIIFFGVFLSILITIIWIVFYFRNNAFKSFYPKKDSSLYKEWLLLLLVCLINCSYPISFTYAKDFRARSYFTEEQFSHRIDIISMASLFADGGYKEDGISYIEKNGQTVSVKKDSFEYGNRSYNLRSLLNKSTSNFSYQTEYKDSINELRAKKWLIENRKDSVLWVMTEFDKIAKSHHAVGNITPKQWVDLVYDFPEYTKYITVGRTFRFATQDIVTPVNSEEAYAYDEDGQTIDKYKLLDTVSNTIKVINKQTYIYPKYYVPLRQIENSYKEMSEAWANPDVDAELLLVYLYFGMMLSLVVFSFRVTSGRNWLIALVAFGVTALVTGILNLLLTEVFFRDTFVRHFEEYFYFGFWLIIIAVLLVYFHTTKRAKGFTGIALNILLWLMPWVLPVIGMFVNEYFKVTAVYVNGSRVSPRTGLEAWLYENVTLFMALCLVAFLLYMYFFTRYIKKWKGTAEA
ncbi:MAG TPA: hypothetical protein VK623_11785 [Flavobacterium sp.]|nr:hypothetical protein [Flavobacterium sp.]